MLGAAGAQSPARSVRAPRTMAPWRGGDAGTVALAALVRAAGAVPALEPLPGRSASARSPGRSPGCLAPGRPRGALSAPPRPALPLASAASSPSKFGASSPTAMLPCFPVSQARAAQCAQREGRLDAQELLPSPRATATSALRGRALHGNFLSGCRRLRLRCRGASRPQLTPPSPPARLPRLPSTCTPPLRRTRLRAPPFLPWGSTTDQYNRSPSPFFSPSSPVKPKRAL